MAAAHRPEPLERTGLATRAEIEGLFRPFIERELASGDAEWRAEFGRRKRKLLKQTLRRLFGARDRAGGIRDKGVVEAEYEEAWRRIDYGMYDLAAPRTFVSPWVYGEHCWFAADAGATRVRQLLLQRVVERVAPQRVLEVGCGNGINLVMLASRFPGLELTGVELTHEGVRAATELQRRPALPGGMRDYAPQPVLDETAFRRIDFRQGDAGALPFGDGSFDLVFTMLALEQMESLRQRALAEIARVSCGHALMIEPFADVNAGGWRRLNVFRRNYFRGRIEDLPGLGLSPEIVTADFPQEIFLGACLVLARKGRT
jgi:SAM-dependent methyltransferase